MGLLSVLKIIELSLELALAITRTLPPEQAAGFWTRHETRLAFWQGVAERLDAAGQLLTGATLMDTPLLTITPPLPSPSTPFTPPKGGVR